MRAFPIPNLQSQSSISSGPLPPTSNFLPNVSGLPLNFHSAICNFHFAISSPFAGGLTPGRILFVKPHRSPTLSPFDRDSKQDRLPGRRITARCDVNQIQAQFQPGA